MKICFLTLVLTGCVLAPLAAFAHHNGGHHHGGYGYHHHGHWGHERHWNGFEWIFVPIWIDDE